jgi:hypothetical protein
LSCESTTEMVHAAEDHCCKVAFSKLFVGGTF